MKTCDRCHKDMKGSECWGIGSKAYKALALCAKCKKDFMKWMKNDKTL